MNAKEFLAEDFKHFAESYWRNEEAGETRVNWLIALTTAIFGGLITLLTSEYRPSYCVLSCSVILPALGANLIFGIMTLLRIRKRDLTTDFYHQVMGQYRAAFEDEKVIGEINKALSKKPERSFAGGLRNMTMGINAMICAAMVFVIGYAVAKWWPQAGNVPVGIATYSTAVLVFVGAALLQHRWIDGRKTDRAGGIVFRGAGTSVEFLLTTAKENKQEWLFPKGHVEPGELTFEAAMREVREETGCIAAVVKSIGKSRFKIKGEDVVVEFFLMQYVGEGKRGEKRSVEWYSFEHAQAKLTHPENKTLLRDARECLEDLANSRG